MEDILQKCCKADNEAILQGTKELKEALKKPEAIAALCDVVVTAQDAQIRQYAAVVLGRRMAKYKHWAKISTDDRAVIKQGILRALVNEPHKPVRNSIAYFIGVIMKHEAPKTGWAELEQALFELPLSNDPAQRELGMYLLSVLVDMNPKLFVPSADKLCAFVSSFLKPVTNNQSITPEVYYSLDILKSLAQGTENIQVVVNTAYEAVPIIIKMIYALSKNDEERTIKFIQLLDELSDSVPLVFDPHLKIIVDMCLQIAKEEDLADEVRMKAMAFLGLLVTKKKKGLLKYNVVQSILDTLFFIVASVPPDPVEFEDDEDTPSTVANQTLDSLALNLPPGKVVNPMLKHIEAGIESVKPYSRKAACLAMAVMAEGCAEYIRTKHLQQFIQYVLKGIQDEYAVVRNAALFALGQFSEHLQPDISNYSEEVMPVLFSYLDNLCSIMKESGDPFKHPDHVTRMFYALEMFCENLNERLIPYLPAVVERLLSIFVAPVSVKVRELAISALNSAASAAKEEMAPYVPKILEALHGFLTQPQDAELSTLQIHSVDTLAVLARSLGKENFRPLAGESLKIALTLIERVNDPDLRRTTYGLLGALSGILEREMEGVLEHIVTVMLGALKSEQGNTILDIEERDENQFAVYDVSDDTDEEDIEEESDRSDDLDGCQVHIEDSYTEEKEEACSALGELAKNTGPAFLPYFERCLAQLVNMINHPGLQIRCAALDAFAEMTAALGAAAPDKAEEQQKALSFIVPKCAEVIQTDYERDVVAAALDALDTLLVKIKGPVLQADGHLEAIVNSILLVLTGKTECQEDEGEEPTDEDGDSEQDEVLFEYAGNLIPSLGKAMPHERFLELFKSVLPLLLSKAKEQNSTAQKSFVVGTLAETMEILGAHAGTYFDQLLPLFLQFANAEEDEVRNNAIFGLGELVLYSKEAAFPSYPGILMHLSKAVSKETVPGNLDNICGALARMIIVNPNIVPIEDVLAALVTKLPLREDFEENYSIFQCLNLLYQMKHPTIQRLIPDIIRVAITVLYRKEHGKKETLASVVTLLTNIKRDFAEEFRTSTSALTTEQLQVLQERLAETS